MKIERKVYLDRLIARKHNGFVKIITGIRRCGQRYLLFNQQMRLVGWTNTATGEIRSPYEGLQVGECRKYAFSGIHYISEKILPLLQQRQGAFPIMDFYLEMAEEHPIYGYVQDDLHVVDIGKPDTLASAGKLFKNDR